MVIYVVWGNAYNGMVMQVQLVQDVGYKNMCPIIYMRIILLHSWSVMWWPVDDSIPDRG